MKEFFKTKIFPIIIVILLLAIVLGISAPISFFIESLFSPEIIKSYRWISSSIEHFIQMVAAIGVMLILGGGLKNFGFTLKSKKLYVVPAIIVGILFGIIMTIVDHFPAILSGSKIMGYDLTRTNVIGWLLYEWVLVGISEEILVRGMMMTYLMRKFDGHVRFFKWDVHVAGVIIAVLFALMHLGSFWEGNLIYAAGQQIYAFILGLIYAYFYEKSQSLLAPIISHNFANGVEFLLLFLLIWFGY